MMETVSCLDVISLALSITAIVLTLRKKVPKWEYFEEGIRFFNKNNEVTIEHDKPLKK